MPGMVRDGAYRHVRTPDFALHEWALDESEDRDDLDVVKTANPAPWLTIEELRKRRDSPSTTEWQFARWTCGVWLSGEDSAIQAGEWRACADPDVVIPETARDVVIGIDLGWRRDCTAIVPVWRPLPRRAGDRRHARHHRATRRWHRNRAASDLRPVPDDE